MAEQRTFQDDLPDNVRRSILITMRQLHEEVVEIGFYQPHKEADYVKVFPAAAGLNA